MDDMADMPKYSEADMRKMDQRISALEAQSAHYISETGLAIERAEKVEAELAEAKAQADANSAHRQVSDIQDGWRQRQGEVDMLIARAKKAEAERDALRKALEFYASDASWMGGEVEVWPPVIRDGGDKARAALVQLVDKK